MRYALACKRLSVLLATSGGTFFKKIIITRLFQSINTGTINHIKRYKKLFEEISRQNLPSIRVLNQEIY